MTNVINFPDGTQATTQTDGTPIPIVLGGGRVFRCGRCTRTFTAQTWHCIENMREDADGLAWHTDVCRRCAYHDPILSHWQELCDVLDSIDGVMQDAADADARGLLYNLITSATEHFAVWRWPNEDPAPILNRPCRCSASGEGDEEDEL